MEITLLELAQRHVGIGELVGGKHHPLIQWWLSLCHGFTLNSPDEIPWCSAAMNGWAWTLDLPRSKSAAARSWLLIGKEIGPHEVKAGFDIVIFKRGSGHQPGPEVTEGAPGHVAVYSHRLHNGVYVVGGNQSNSVRVSRYPEEDVIGYRRLW